VFASGPTSPLTLSAMKKLSTTVCYLCGKPLVPSTNVDHPIMQQIFAPEIRRKHNISRLIQSCNTSYKRDEDYFVRTLIPFARGSEAGNAIYAKALNDYRIGKQVPLTKKVLSEFDPNPSGLTLPGGKVVASPPVYGVQHRAITFSGTEDCAVTLLAVIPEAARVNCLARDSSASKPSRFEHCTCSS